MPFTSNNVFILNSLGIDLVFHGDPKGDVSEVQVYNEGVKEGAFGLSLNSVVLRISSFFIEPMCQWIGARLVWVASNFTVFACMVGTVLIGFVSVRQSSNEVQHVNGANGATKIASLVVFALLGLPLSISILMRDFHPPNLQIVTYKVPFSVTVELTADSGGGQGFKSTKTRKLME